MKKIDSKKIFNIVQIFCKMIIMLLISASIGILLLVIAYSIPTGSIKENVKKSVEQIFLEGDHFSVFGNLHFTDIDNYSDANYLNGAMINNSAKGIFTCLYGLEYKNKNMEINYDSPVTVLKNVFLEGAKLDYKEYGKRFWNGYEIIIKLMLVFFTYGQIRYVNFFLEIILLSLLSILMYKKNLTNYIIPLIISYLFLGPITMALSMVFSGFLYCTYISCIIMLIFNDKLKQKHLYQLYFMFIGIIVAYFNMNYIQILSFTYAFTFYYLLNDLPESIKEVISIFLGLFICWVFGYCGMFMMKWVVYRVIIGEPIINDMIVRTIYRISATAYYTGPPISRIMAVFKNLKNVVLNIPWIIIEIGYIIWAIVIFRKEKKNNISKIFNTKITLIVIILLMSILVILRYLIFANHIYVHDWVMYRIVDAMIFTFNIFIMNCIQSGDIGYGRGI